MTTGRIFTPFQLGGFTIIPEGEPLPGQCGIPLYLGKKGAFGSGEHETTAACLQQLENIAPLSGCRALDLGSGTGILAIAALLLGAESAVAVDIEWPAALSCSINAALNGVGSRLLTVCGELEALTDSRFELVMANIYADILLPLADRLVELTAPGGLILLSGIPLQDKYDVWSRYTRLGCREVDAVIGEEFVTYLLKKG
jgi:ribosomal protein L11 methyltransferase